MTKELEALEKIKNSFGCDMAYYSLNLEYETVEQALQRLESIDNSNPSEALECWQWINATIPQWVREKDKEHPNVLEPIKQALLKAQEQEKEIAYIEKIKTMMKQKDCALRYIESEDCFAVKTILSDGWYKLTPELVENNVREEIKPLPLIEKNKQLKEENAEYKKVLKIIFEKNVNIGLIKVVGSVEQYNQTYVYDNMRNVKWCLIEEEFDLLKRYCDEIRN